VLLRLGRAIAGRRRFRLTHVRALFRVPITFPAGEMIDAGLRVDSDHDGARGNGLALKSWSTSRNKGVHTARMNQDDFSDPMLQGAITRVIQVQTLLNQLVFKLIGYSDTYIDYGRPDYPARVF